MTKLTYNKEARRIAIQVRKEAEQARIAYDNSKLAVERMMKYRCTCMAAPFVDLLNPTGYIKWYLERDRSWSKRNSKRNRKDLLKSRERKARIS